VENNVVMVDHWHGISFYGAKNCKFVNNTVVDINTTGAGPAWLHGDRAQERHAELRETSCATTW
jgi:parallel beta-helix repeat protein